jgi:hypothetical protein
VRQWWSYLTFDKSAKREPEAAVGIFTKRTQFVHFAGFAELDGQLCLGEHTRCGWSILVPAVGISFAQYSPSSGHASVKPASRSVWIARTPMVLLWMTFDDAGDTRPAQF